MRCPSWGGRLLNKGGEEISDDSVVGQVEYQGLEYRGTYLVGGGDMGQHRGGWGRNRDY